MKIPFVDLKSQYLSIKNEIDEAISKVIDETSFINGKHVQKFEKNFADKLGVNSCIAVANGTDAIYIVLKMMGIGAGDEVITVCNSWISTSETITQAGAKPVFCDIEPDYYTIDPQDILKKLSHVTKAIIPVHLYGQPARIDEIKQICDENNLFLIEDCAQSHFSEYKGIKTASFGTAATFSFYPGKNLGAYGDAGAIVTNDVELAEKCRMYANHGALIKHNHLIEGINSRMDGLHGAILSVKLNYIDQWNTKRLENALLYNRLLSEVEGIEIPKIRQDCKHIFHVYCIRVKQRDKLQIHLKAHGIETAIHYPTILPLLPAYYYMDHVSEDFPIASSFQDQILSLPMYPELTEEQIHYVADCLKSFN